MRACLNRPRGEELPKNDVGGKEESPPCNGATSQKELKRGDTTLGLGHHLSKN